MIFCPKTNDFHQNMSPNSYFRSILDPNQINCELHFSRIKIFLWDQISWFFVSGTFIWLFIELSKEFWWFSFFLNFFMYFHWKISQSTAHLSYDKGAYSRKYMILGDFPIKIHEKSRRIENHQNSFDNSINNHINVSETEGQVILSNLDPLQPGKKFDAIKLT